MTIKIHFFSWIPIFMDLGKLYFRRYLSSWFCKSIENLYFIKHLNFWFTLAFDNWYSTNNNEYTFTQALTYTWFDVVAEVLERIFSLSWSQICFFLLQMCHMYMLLIQLTVVISLFFLKKNLI